MSEQSKPPGGGADERLAAYRDSIDNIDAALIYMLAERFKITRRIGEHKADYGLPARDTIRERAQIERLRQLSNDAKLNSDVSANFLREVIAQAVRCHERIRSDRRGVAAEPNVPG